MTDREKTIQHLEMVKEEIRTSKYDTWFSGGKKFRFMGYVDDAIELLKVQEPARAIREFSDDFSYDGGSWWYECGNCQNPVDYHDVFCSYCGKRLKWDD